MHEATLAATMGTETFMVQQQEAGSRLDHWLARVLASKRERVRALIVAGMVRIRGKACSPNRRLFGGELVVVRRPEPRPAEPSANEPTLSALYDDAEVVVVAKPAGLAVEPARPGLPSAVGAASRLGRFDVAGRATPGLAHRLDKDTSGCLLLARTDRALAALKHSFDRGHVVKEYLALVAGTPPERCALDDAYGRRPEDPRRFTTRTKSARRARLSFAVERRFASSAALLRVRLETGRTHQIRVQLADAGWPVLGDAVYGTRSPLIDRQALHAERLSFPRPSDGRRVDVVAPLPEDFCGAMASLTRSRTG